MSKSLIELEDIHFSYPEHAVLKGVHLSLREGDRIGIMGAIGSGKTTLLHLLVGLLKPGTGRLRAFGRVRVAEDDFHEVRSRAGLVFQDPDDQLFCPVVLEDVAFGPLNLGQSPDHAKRTAREALRSVGLAGFEDRVTYRLSGGEKRLVALATVLAMRPEVLLLDEPQNGLDRAARARVLNLLAALPQSLIVVSHDRAFLEAATSDCLFLRHGRIGRDAGE